MALQRSQRLQSGFIKVFRAAVMACMCLVSGLRVQGKAGCVWIGRTFGCFVFNVWDAFQIVQVPATVSTHATCGCHNALDQHVRDPQSLCADCFLVEQVDPCNNNCNVLQHYNTLETKHTPQNKRRSMPHQTATTILLHNCHPAAQ